MGKEAWSTGAVGWAVVVNLVALLAVVGAMVIGICLVGDGTASAVELLALTAGASGLGLLVKGVAILGGAARQAARHAEQVLDDVRARQVVSDAAARRAAWHASRRAARRAGEKVPAGQGALTRTGAQSPGPGGTDAASGPSQDPLAAVRADARRGGAVLVWAGLIAFTVGVVGAWKAADEPHRSWCRDEDPEAVVIADCLHQKAGDEGR